MKNKTKMVFKLNNLKLSARLLINFAVIILFCIGIGVYSVCNFRNLSVNTEKMYNGPYTGMRAVMQVKTDIIKIYSLMQEITTLSDPEEMLNISEEINRQEADVFYNFKQFEKHYTGDRQPFTDLKIAFIDWKPIRDEIVNLSIAGMNDVAAKITAQEGNAQVELLMAAIEPFLTSSENETLNFLNKTKSAADNALVVNIVMIFLCIIVAILVAVWTARIILTPLTKIQAITSDMAKGNLKVEINSPYTNEIGQLTNSLSQTLQNFFNTINGVDKVLLSIAEGKMDIPVEGEYVGDFITIKSSLVKILNSLNNVLSEIGYASEKVTLSSKEVLSISQNLSISSKEGAEETFALRGLTEKVALQARRNADFAVKATKLAEVTKHQASDGSQSMSETLDSMENIAKTANDIQKIVSSMEDIAFQTRILSINASVEAAHAGVHGKGFAIVAQEVQSLAAKSTEAAKQISILAENTKASIENGITNTNQTAKVLTDIIGSMNETVPIIYQIANDSNEESTAIEDILSTVEKIRVITEKTNFEAERSETESDKMDKQSCVLKEQISKFKLKQEGVVID